METEDIRNELEEAFSDPGAMRSGERLLDLVRAVFARALEESQRGGIVLILGEWLQSHREPQTTLALRLVEDFHIREASADIERLRADVAAGKSLYPFYITAIDRVMDKL